MCWRNLIVTGSFETGAVHDAFESDTRSGSDRANDPLLRQHGSLTLSVASPAVEITFALVVAVYSWSVPGVNAPNDAGLPSISDSVAGTLPPTDPPVLVSR